MNLDILKAPTPPEEIQWRVRSVTKDSTRCSVIAYVDARYMQSRLNEAFGVRGWSLRHEVVDPEKHVVMTTLTIHDMGEDTGDTIKQDFGYPNSASDEEPLKSAASDGLKRCCVHTGLTHDVYAMEARWVPYDAERKQPIMDGQPTSAPARPATPAAVARGLPHYASLASLAEGNLCPTCGKGVEHKQGISKAGNPYDLLSCKGNTMQNPTCDWKFFKPKEDVAARHEAETVQESLTPEDQAAVEESAARAAEVDAIRETWGHRGYLIPPAQAGSLHKWLSEEGYPLSPLPESCTAKVVDRVLSTMSLDMLSRYRAAQEAKRDAEVHEREREHDPGPRDDALDAADAQAARDGFEDQ